MRIVKSIVGISVLIYFTFTVQTFHSGNTTLGTGGLVSQTGMVRPGLVAGTQEGKNSLHQEIIKMTVDSLVNNPELKQAVLKGADIAFSAWLKEFSGKLNDDQKEAVKPIARQISQLLNLMAKPTASRAAINKELMRLKASLEPFRLALEEVDKEEPEFLRSVGNALQAQGQQLLKKFLEEHEQKILDEFTPMGAIKESENAAL